MDCIGMTNLAITLPLTLDVHTLWLQQADFSFRGLSLANVKNNYSSKIIISNGQWLV